MFDGRCSSFRYNEADLDCYLEAVLKIQNNVFKNKILKYLQQAK